MAERKEYEMNFQLSAAQSAGFAEAFGDAGKTIESMQVKIKTLNGEQTKAGESVEGYGEKARAGFSAAGAALAAAGLIKGLKEVAAAFRECVDSAAGFEQTMSKVEALSQASETEMAALSAEAKRLGATTAFTATEAAEAMTYMGQAGWSAAEMLAGMDGVIQLAAASGEDLAQTSDIVTDNLTAFGLKASDTAHFSDVLAMAAAATNTSVAMMGETFKNSAALAGALGFTIEDVSVAVGLMANSGIKASIAGTSLKNIFQGLLEGATLTSEAFGEVEFSLVKVDGTTKTFSETIQELRGYFEQMTGAEKTMNAETIAGMRGMAGFLSIVNATDDDFDSLTASIGNCSGAAKQMAEVKLDNFNGQVTLLNSALDAVKTTIGEVFLDDLRKLAAGGTSVLTVVNGYLSKHPEIIKAVAAFAVTIGGVTAALVAYSAAAKLFAAASALMASAIPGLNVILGVTAVVAAGAAAVTAYATSQRAMLEEFNSLTPAARAQRVSLEELRREHEKAKEQFGDNSTEASLLQGEIEKLSVEFETGKQSLSEYVEESQRLNEQIAQTLGANRDAFAQTDAQAASVDALVGRLSVLQGQTDLTVGEQEEMKAIVDRLNEVVPGLALNYEDVASGAQNVGEATDAAVEKMIHAAKTAAAQKGLTDATEQLGQAELLLERLRENQLLANAELVSAQEAYLALMETAGAAGNEQGQGLYMLLFGREEGARLRAAEEAMAAVNGQIAQTETTAADARGEVAYYRDALGGLAKASADAAGGHLDLDTTLQNAQLEVEELARAWSETYTKIRDEVASTFSIWDEAAQVSATSVGQMQENLLGQAAYWEEYNANLQALKERAPEIEGLGAVLASFADGSSQSVNAVAGMATATDAELEKMVTAWQEQQTAVSTVSGTIETMTTDFGTKMSEILTQTQQTVKDMELTDEAALAAQNTIQGFIDGATGMTAQVVEAYRAIAQAAINAVNAELDIGSPSRVMEKLAQYTWQGFTLGTRAMQPEVTAAMAETSAAGIAAAVPAATASGGHSEINITFSIGGNADMGTVELLRGYGDEFAQKVRAVIAEDGVNAARRAYV